MENDIPTHSRSARHSLRDVVVLAVMFVPGPAAFAAYVLWVVLNGGDSYSGQGPFYPAVHDLSLSLRNVGAISFNGLFHAIVAALLGLLVSTMIDISRSQTDSPARQRETQQETG